MPVLQGRCRQDLCATYCTLSLLSHSNSFSFEMEKDAAGCRAFNRNFIVGGTYVVPTE